MKFRLIDYKQQFKKHESSRSQQPLRAARTQGPSRCVPTKLGCAPYHRSTRPKHDQELGRATHADPAADRSDHYVRSDRGQQGRGLSPAGTFPRLGEVNAAELSVADGELWERNQLAKAAQPDLFNPDGFPELQPAPFQSEGQISMRRHRMPWLWAVAAGLGDRPGRAEVLRESGPYRSKQMLREEYEALFGVGHRYPICTSGTCISTPPPSRRPESGRPRPSRPSPMKANCSTTRK
jgi:hypothetical protein